MGYGSWKAEDYVSYANSTGRNTISTSYTNADGSTSTYTSLNSSYNAQDIFKSRQLDPKLDPYHVMRECNDSDEHPNTIPVILALDVTGSMGAAAAEVAKKLNVVMSKLYETVTDVECMIMAVGDLAYDRTPIQISQFEADIRVAEWLDKVYFERGGGGNQYESYTAVWYMGLHHMMLDSWKRGKKGIIITLGDEPLNPYLPKDALANATGDKLQGDVETAELYRDASDKFDIYHIAVDDSETCYNMYAPQIDSTWGKYLDSEHLRISRVDEIVDYIIDIVSHATGTTEMAPEIFKPNMEIGW